MNRQICWTAMSFLARGPKKPRPPCRRENAPRSIDTSWSSRGCLRPDRADDPCTAAASSVRSWSSRMPRCVHCPLFRTESLTPTGKGLCAAVKDRQVATEPVRSLARPFRSLDDFSCHLDGLIFDVHRRTSSNRSIIATAAAAARSLARSPARPLARSIHLTIARSADELLGRYWDSTPKSQTSSRGGWHTFSDSTPTRKEGTRMILWL